MRLEIPALLILSTLVAAGKVKLYIQPDCKGKPMEVQDQKATGTCQAIDGHPGSVAPDSTDVNEIIWVYSEPNCNGTRSGPFLGDNGDGKNCARGQSFEIVKAFSNIVSFFFFFLFFFSLSLSLSLGLIVLTKNRCRVNRLFDFLRARGRISLFSLLLLSLFCT